MIFEQKIRAINIVVQLKALARTLFLGHRPPSPRRGHEVTQILGHFNVFG